MLLNGEEFRQTTQCGSGANRRGNRRPGNALPQCGSVQIAGGSPARNALPQCGAGANRQGDRQPGNALPQCGSVQIAGGSPARECTAAVWVGRKSPRGSLARECTAAVRVGRKSPRGSPARDALPLQCAATRPQFSGRARCRFSCSCAGAAGRRYLLRLPRACVPVRFPGPRRSSRPA